MDGLSLGNHVADYLKMVSKDEIATELGGIQILIRPEVLCGGSKEGQQKCMCPLTHPNQGARPQAWPYLRMSNSL